MRFLLSSTLIGGLAVSAGAVVLGMGLTSDVTSGNTLPMEATASTTLDVASILKRGAFLRGRDNRSLVNQDIQARPPHHEFYFARAIYGSGGGLRGFGGGWGRRGSWYTDAPNSDFFFLAVVNRLIDVDAYQEFHPMAMDDPELRRYPFLYILEVGRMRMTEPEIEGLRSYLLAGGFLMVDDFWGSAEWANFEWEMGRLFPEYAIVDIPMDHPLFHMVYDIDEIKQVPNVRNAQAGITHERDGFVPYVKGIFDDEGRMMVAINWNTDLGDAWEWAENPYYPIEYSRYASEVAVNTIVYAMSH